MDLSISGRHVAVTDAMRDHARQRVERFERLSPHIMGVKVTLSIEGDRQIAEVVASVRRKGEVVAKAESHDMYLSIDQAVAKAEKQLDRLEDRFTRHRKDARQKRSVAEGGIPDAGTPPGDDDAPEEEA
jgi:putative sigma-54 modulation protein